MKRESTGNDAYTSQDAKRQKIEVASQMPVQAPPAALSIDADFAAMLAKAAEATDRAIAAQYAKSTAAQRHQPEPQINPYQQEIKPMQSNGYQPDILPQQSSMDLGSKFANDPYLYMRILSLPILESLVSESL